MPNVLQSIVVPFAMFGVVAAGRAQWEPRLSAVPGYNDDYLAAAFHAGTHRTILVGASGTSAFDGRGFVPLPGPTPARVGTAMTYDRARNRIVLFGGSAAGTFASLGDTWEFDGVVWTQRSPSTAPSARTGASLVYDTWRQLSVLVGGFSNGLGLGDTWEWNGQNWTLRAVNVPGVRGGAASAFEEVRGLVSIYGGMTVLGGPLRNDFWQFDGQTWQRRVSAAMPSARSNAAMASDPWNGNLVLFGGQGAGGTLLADTWRWDGRVWSQVAPALAPAARSGHAMVYDNDRHQIVLLGGSNPTGALAEVWNWTEDPRAHAMPFGSGCGLQLSAANGSLPELGTSLQLQMGVPAGAMLFSLGFSDLAASGAPLPRALPGGCFLHIEPAASVLVQPSSAGIWPFAIPSAPYLLGARLYGQTFALGGVPALLSSNGLALRVGRHDPNLVTMAALDPATQDLPSSAILGALVGGDGHHGDFSTALGQDLGNGVFEIQTNNTTIPASQTSSGLAEQVTDGHFSFASFVVPAGVTVRFRGSVPAVVRVRGEVRIDGTLDASADPLPAFFAGWSTAVDLGQDGGRGGPGGATGGRGGHRCLGFGPGSGQFHGQAGGDLRVAAGHALALAALGTGGHGAQLFPAHGNRALLQYAVSSLLNGDLSAGGGGGGFRGPGGAGIAQGFATGVNPGPSHAGGLSLVVPPVPSGIASLDYYQFGGAGGGGGGSHSFSSAHTLASQFRAGAGGGGGGGVLALRTGSSLTIGSTGRVLATGGDGQSYSVVGGGLPAPGGGGSGGSVLLQAASVLRNQGVVDVSGGTGSQIVNLPSFLAANSQGGIGADGLVRMESPQPITGGVVVPAWTAADLGPLVDSDTRTGLRSIWLPVTVADEARVMVRYELSALWNGVPTVFSDDPAIGPGLDDPNGAIVMRFQSALRDANGQPDPATIGPWRRFFGTSHRETCNLDVPHFVRIELTWPTVGAPVIQGLELIWH